MLTLHVPERVRSAACANVGAGAYPPSRQAFIEDAITSASNIHNTGVVPARDMALASNRVQLRSKNKKVWHEFPDNLASLDPMDAANALAEVQAKRPSLHDFGNELTHFSSTSFDTHW